MIMAGKIYMHMYHIPGMYSWFVYKKLLLSPTFCASNFDDGKLVYDGEKTVLLGTFACFSWKKLGICFIC